MKTTGKILRRNLETKVELRADVAGDGLNAPHLFGYAAKFNSESHVMWDEDLVDDLGDPIPFVEVLDPHCFDRTLRERPDVVALFNHDTNAVLGRVSAGTLALSVDQEGLYFDDELPDTTHGRDARVLVRRGDIKGCSFGFNIVEERVTLRPGLPALRILLDVALHEVTIATAFPAYPATETQLRSLARLAAASPAGMPLGLARAKFRLG